MKNTENWSNEVVLTEPSKRKGPRDYHYLFCKGMTESARQESGIGGIWINAAVCVHCKDYIRSMNRHDFKWCSCGKVAVDGGSAYVRRIGNDNDYINCIEYFTNKSETGI